MSCRRILELFSSSDSDSGEEDAINFKRKKRFKGKKSDPPMRNGIRRISPPRFDNNNSTRDVGSSGDETLKVVRTSSNGINWNQSLDKVVADVLLPHRSVIHSGGLTMSNSQPAILSNGIGSPKLPRSDVGAVGLIPPLIPKELTPAEIIKTMGFSKWKNGLGQYVTWTPMDLESKVKELGITDGEIKMISLDDAPLSEAIHWIGFEDSHAFTTESLLKERKLGKKPSSFDFNENNAFVDPKLYLHMIACKKLYNDMPESLYKNYRSKANLFEKIGKGRFVSRAAMKMANLDAILNFELTQPKAPDGKFSVDPRTLFYFADVCAGPGGFTEYILWRKRWEAKGFGFTLKGELDFDVKNFGTAEADTFEAIYGPADDGNVYNPANVNAFINHVMFSTDHKGVHLMMADGGFTVSKQEYLQEVLSQQIILSQLVIALGVVREGGHFLCKFFDCVTPFTVAIIYFMYVCFDTIAIHKPHTSRPANSERYVICKWKKSSDATSPIAAYLHDCHQLMWDLQHDPENTETILELLSLTSITPSSFGSYIKACNDRIATNQIAALKRIVGFVRDRELDIGRMQEKVRIQALRHWNVPENIPIPAMIKTCDSACKELLQELPITMMRHNEKELFPSNIELLIKSAYDWRFIAVCGRKNANNRAFYMSLGRSLVYRYEGIQWVIISQEEPILELPSKTLVYGEFTYEVYGGGAGEQRSIEAFHIIDGLCLGGIDIRKMHYTQRQEQCAKFAKSVTKSRNLLVRAKIPVRMENLATFVQKLEHRVVKEAGVGSVLACPFDMGDPYSPYILPEGLLFLKITKEPWQMALNKQTCTKYFFNTKDGMASDHIPEDAVSSFFNTMENRVLWEWNKDTNIVVPSFNINDPRVPRLNPNYLHSFNIIGYVNFTIQQRPTVSPPQSALYVETVESEKKS